MSDKPIATTIRVDTKTQAERHRKAAKALKWTVRRFYLEAADRFAERILAADNPVEQLMVSSDRLTLNQ